MTQKNHVLSGLDIGTTEVTCMIGTPTTNGVDIVGVGKAPNAGMKQGVVVNIESASEAIQKAREEAELMSGISIDSVWLSVGGAHIQSFDSQGMVAIRNKEVTQEDMDRVIDAAKAVAIPNDRQVLHVLPKGYKVDGQDGISDPIGMSGVRLEASVHIVTGSQSAIQNAVKCTNRAGIKIKGLVLQQFASALAVLSDDEKNLGVCVVDMGGGTCDIVSFSQGSVVHTSVIPVGGNNFTHDVAMGLRTTQTNAEILKKKYGCALPSLVNTDQAIEVDSVGGRQARTLSRRDLCEVLEARAEETLSLIKTELEKKGLMSQLGSGVVLTGGGCLLNGLVEMGDFVFDVPVRRGLPDKVGGLTDVVRCSSYASAVGLLIYGLEQEKDDIVEAESEGRLSAKMSDWARKLKELFA